MTTPTEYVLHQFGDDPFKNRYDDLDGCNAFTVTFMGYNPNEIYKISRDPTWATSHPTIMGPSVSWFYFGPLNAPGYIIYGNNRNEHSMTQFMRHKKDDTTLRTFTGQSGKEYRWKVGKERMELLDGRTCIAVWELSDPEKVYHAVLRIKASALPIATEIVTTLALNRMAEFLSWM